MPDDRLGRRPLYRSVRRTDTSGTARDKAMSRKYLIVIILFVIALSGWGYALMQPTEAQTSTFDHSDCQYPYRATNPSDGCDNSDPACPELIKGALSCPSDQPVPAPITTPTSEPQPVASPKNTCS